MSMESNGFSQKPDLERQFDGLLASYRDACPDPEPGPNFMPSLWRAIDSRRNFALSFGRWARGLVTAAAALAMLMAVFVAMPSPQVSPVYLATYVEVLDDDGRADNPAFVEVAHQDAAWESNVQ